MSIKLFDRRELMRVGGLTLGGLGIADLVNAAPRSDGYGTSFGKAKNIIFLYLCGGPPQHETFDPKPDAPAEIRGPFNPIQTNIPGVNFCELLPRTAGIADKIAVIRSMSTDDNIHSSSGHWVLTGYKYQGPNSRTLQPSDWPFYGSIIKRYKPSESMPGLSSIVIPDMVRQNENVTPAGQMGGLMGQQWSPEHFVGDPSRSDYKIEGFEPLGITLDRMKSRRSLQSKIEDRLRNAENSKAVDTLSTYQQQAYELLTSGKARNAFNIQEEPDQIRDRYGRNRWGQSVLLARRLIESGARLVHVNWPREPGDNATDNPLWDTHAQNPDRLEDVLCPIFDVGYTALIEDLEQRGLLDETLVVAIGEFGRTPKINPKSGRDHWGPVFCATLAGAGISGGQVYGSSDEHGAYPKSDKVDPGHLTSTIFHLAGLDYQGTFTDPAGRELAYSKQPVLWDLLGDQPATAERTESTGDVARVPDFDESMMIRQTSFQGREVLKPATVPSRPKGWRFINSKSLEAEIHKPTTIGKLELPQHLAFKATKSESTSTSTFVGQEVRSPFPGTYRLHAKLVAVGGTAASQKAFNDSYSCHLVYFQFTEKAKQIDKRSVMAELEFTPTFAGEAITEPQAVEFTRAFLAPRGNFSFGLGFGVAIEIREKPNAGNSPVDANIAIHVLNVDLEFVGKERNPDITV
jgi:hypothetical protein